MNLYGVDAGTPFNVSSLEKILAADGNKYKFIVRYLLPYNSWKRMTKAEADLIQKYGFMLASVFQEGKAGPAGGAAQGRSDGARAKAEAARLGQPKKSAIFFAVDYDAPVSDYPAFEAYLRAAQEAMGDDYYVGIYGKYEVIENMHARNACKYYWQTYAWSRGKLSPHADLYQFQNDVAKNGVNVDVNQCFNKDIFWGIAANQTPPAPTHLECFTDVPINHYSANSIQKAYTKGKISGVGEKLFGFGQAMTREQLAVMLDKMGLLEVKDNINKPTVPYTDVPVDHWAAGSIAKAYVKGAMEGSGTVFGLGLPATREQFAKVLDSLKYLRKGLGDANITDVFSDVPADHWAAGAILRAYKSGVMLGYGGKFGLGNPLTREDCVTAFDKMGMYD